MSVTINIFRPPTDKGDGECFDTLAQGKAVCIERIFSTGQTTPAGQWLEQETDEWVTLLQGEAELSFADRSALRLAAGDYAFIPAHQKHRVGYTSTSPPCVWLAIHLSAGMIENAEA